MGALKQIVKRAYLFAVTRYQEKEYEKAYCRYKGKSISGNYKKLCRSESKQLFLVPHADDDLLGGYAITKLQKGNIIFGYYGLTGSNNDPENKKRRDKEFMSYSYSIEIPYHFITDEEDLRNLIEDNRIEVVYLPSIFDWHPEHRKLNYMLYKAIDSLNPQSIIEIMWYSITVPICYNDALIAPMTMEEQKEKYSTFSSIYQSQKHMPIKRFIYEERITALDTNNYAAEMCLPINLPDWKNITGIIQADEPDGKIVKQLNGLKQEINNIAMIRRSSERLYKEFLG